MAKLVAEAKIIGALGASKGGFARAESLTSKELSKQGSHAINIRWKEARTYKKTKISKRARTK